MGLDLFLCNWYYLELVKCVCEGICDVGGIVFEFLVYLIQEIGKCLIVSFDWNFVYLGFVEFLYGYLIDGVVLIIGCDKIILVCLMVVVIVNILVIVLFVGFMLNGWYKGECIGLGIIVWKVWQMMVVGEIDYKGFMDLVVFVVLLVGYCNIMGIVMMMNLLVEVFGMQLFGLVVILVFYCECGVIFYEMGKCIVEMVYVD